jgi:hypothetical protein
LEKGGGRDFWGGHFKPVTVAQKSIPFHLPLGSCPEVLIKEWIPSTPPFLLFFRWKLTSILNNLERTKRFPGKK